MNLTRTAQKLTRRQATRILKRMDDWLIDLYASPSAAAQRLMPLLYRLRQVYFYLHSGTRLTMHHMRGIEAETHLPLRVLYLENGQGQRYIESLLFEDGATHHETCGSLPARQLLQAAPRLGREVDLLVVERNHLLRWLPPDGEWMTGPTWVRMVREMELDQPWEQVETALRRRQKENMRRIQRHGFTMEESRSMKDFDAFLDCMHVPTVKERHPGYGIIDARRTMLRHFKRGFLIFLRDDQGERVAGSLNMLRGEVFFGIANGFLVNRPDVLANGALSGLYYYALKWCHENGIRRCDICEVRPFANDGLYKHKERWGFQPVRELWNTREWLFWAPNHSPVAVDWMANHPIVSQFVEYQGDQMQAVYRQETV